MSSTPIPKVSKPFERALAEIGVTSLEQVAKHTRAELSALHGVGPKGMRMLDEALSANHLTYRD
jgi:predicted flap endonuclease-1-like 5' DNA nuclease